MELRSRKSLNPNTPAPAPAVTSVVSQPASLGRSATEPPFQHKHEDPELISNTARKKLPVSIAPAIEAVQTKIAIVPASRAQSTPATLSSEAQAFHILKRLFGARLSTEDFAAYKTLISDLVSWNPKDFSQRDRTLRALGAFLGSRPEALKIHDRFARSYNKTKNQKFHVPEFGKPTSAKLQKPSAATQVRSNGKRLKLHAPIRLPIVEPIVERMMEISKAEDGLEDNNEDPYRNGAGEKDSAGPDILHVRFPSETNSGASSNEQTPIEGDEAFTRITIATSPSGDQATQREETEDRSDLALAANTVPSINGHARERRISKGEQAHKSASAVSYLAWLHHRQARFPTARPNFSECVLVAKKLQRPSVVVHGDVLRHWSLETDGQYGSWYRQNRSHVLGEDPRFDAEHMGTWKAWLKQGRDEMGE